MSYKSPIEVIQTQPEYKFDGLVYEEVRRVGVNVDKDELLKALEYDRNQYEMGLKDGRAEVIEKLSDMYGEVCESHDNCKNYGSCMECMIERYKEMLES